MYLSTTNGKQPSGALTQHLIYQQETVPKAENHQK